MLPWWISSIVIVSVAALSAFAGAPADTARILLFLFIVVTVLLVVARILGRRRPPGADSRPRGTKVSGFLAEPAQQQLRERTW